MTRRLLQGGLWLVLGTVLLACAWLVINTTFMFYDDEGYLLLSYINFLGGAPLYDEVFTQYGPWPYLYHQLLTTIVQQPVTHEFGRNVTAVHWLICALSCGAIAIQLGSRLLVAICTTLIAFTLLWQMNAEPSHPGSLIAAMLALVAVAAVVLHQRGRWTLLGICIGVITALLLMTKINVGLLFMAGAGVGALLLTAWPERWRRPAGILAVVGLLAVPWGLMWGQLSEPWVRMFAVQFTAAAAGLLWVSPAVRHGRPVPPRTWAIAAAALLVVLTTTIVAVCVQGSSLSALLQAILINPLRHPSNLMFGLPWGPATWPVTIVCWLATVWAGWQLRRNGELGRATAGIIVALRLLAVVMFMIHAKAWLSFNGVSMFVMYCMALLPIFLVPLEPAEGARQGRSEALLWVAGIALPQVLSAFPVAGSQMGFGSFLYIPILVIGFAAALQFAARTLAHSGRWLPQVGCGLLLLVGSGQLAWLSISAWDRFRTSRPLDLPGAAALRIGEPLRLTFRTLALNASVHADLLYSRPGMFSFNLWSGVPTPTLQNATQWFWLLESAAQLDIAARLGAAPRSAIITNQVLDEFVEHIKGPLRSPLDTHIREHYRPLFERHGFHFLVPLVSRAVAFGLVEQSASPRQPPLAEVATALTTNIKLDGAPAHIGLVGAVAPWVLMTDFVQQGARISLVPINAQGDSLGAAIDLPVAQPLRGLYRLTIAPAQLPLINRPQDVVLTVLGPDGAVLSESIF